MSQMFCAFTVFGRDLLDGTVSSAVLFIILIELALLVIDLIALLIIVLVKRVGMGKSEKDYYVAATAAATPVTLRDLVLDTSAVRRRFNVGEPFSFTGLSATALYSDGSQEDIPDFSVEAPDTSVAGDAIVTVRYRDTIAEYSIFVAEPVASVTRTLLSIEPDLAAVRTAFTAGETFSSEGLAVIAHFDTEPYKENVTGFAVSAPDITLPGVYDVQVSYEGQTCTYSVTVTALRRLLGISLDTSSVVTTFTVGDTFSCDGLVVVAGYNAEPYSETVTDYTVETPDLSAEGEREVTISYCGAAASYTVKVLPAAELPFEETEESSLRYDRSFTARLIQSDDDVKDWYNQIKNELLSYKKVKDRMSWKRETYKCGKAKVALMSFRGKSLCLYLALDPTEFAESKYKVEDASVNASSTETPLMYRIKNEKRMRYALQLIEIMMSRLGVERTERESQDYYLPYEGTLELINKGLIKRNLVTGTTEVVYSGENAVEEIAAAAGPEVSALILEEESVEGGKLRYDRSITARLIQADDEVKDWYNQIKNELLSYKKVKDRMSWKRETYKYGKSKIALIGFRGKVLCLYLALDPTEFAESKYKVEDASGNASCAETPLLYRVKNEKRMRYALQLIEIMMSRLNTEKTDRTPVDYRMPYEGILELLNKGLIKRNIKSSTDEEIFLNK